MVRWICCSGKQVQILYGPAAVRRISDDPSYPPPQAGDTPLGKSEKAEIVRAESKYPAATPFKIRREGRREGNN